MRAIPHLKVDLDLSRGENPAALTKPPRRLSSMRNAAKILAAGSGALGAFHFARNRSNLTVVMFHRVLPGNSPAQKFAKPDYTITNENFAACLTFFKRYYNVVSLEDVLAAVQARAALPAYPLLITFDDGWDDILKYAAPILQAERLPAVCFAISDAIESQPYWWQGAFGLGWSRGLITEAAVRDAPLEGDETDPHAGSSERDPYFNALARFQQASATSKHQLLESWLGRELCAEYAASHRMLKVAELKMLINSNIAIGAHGATHLPLTLNNNSQDELSRARRDLEKWTSDGGQKQVTALSFPFGRYSVKVQRDARAVGYQVMFSSTANMTRLESGRLPTDLCGRIELASRYITDSQGRFRPDLLGLHLFRRPVVRIANTGLR